jgi:hypothetical protein
MTERDLLAPLTEQLVHSRPLPFLAVAPGFRWLVWAPQRG